MLRVLIQHVKDQHSVSFSVSGDLSPQVPQKCCSQRLLMY